MRTLYITPISTTELAKQWDMDKNPLVALFGQEGYIQCTKEGKIDFFKNSVYSAKELVERNNVKIIRQANLG